MHLALVILMVAGTLIAAPGGVVNPDRALALSESDPTTTWNVTPQSLSFPRDRSCPAGSTLIKDQFPSLTDGPGTGTDSGTYTVDGQSVTVQLDYYADNSFDFTVTGGVMVQLFVKGSTFLLFQYEPPVSGATNTGAVTYDTGLHDGIGGNPDTYQDVSHLDFCLGTTAPEPSVEIEKSTNGQDADDPTGPYVAVGDLVTWEYVVTNTGDTSLTNIVVTDDQGVSVSCPATELAAGESMTCMASGTATAGQYANLGSVSASGAGESVSDSDPSHYFGVASGIEIEKSTNGQDADDPTGPYVAVGDPVTWEYVVTNTGNTALSNVSVTDDQGVSVSCPKDTLAAGESMTCTASGTATAGQYANLGTASGSTVVGRVTDSDPSHYFGVSGGLDIEKATNGVDADDPTGPLVPVGGAVSWSYVVTNNVNTTVTGIVVTDDQGVSVSCPATELAAGASMTCTASGVAVAGQYANLGSVVGVDAAGRQLTDDDPSHYYGVTAGIDIEKSTNDQDADDPTGPFVVAGDTVTWEYRVRNLGNTPIGNVVVTDDQGVTPLYKSGDLDLDGFLDPSETWVYTATGVAVVGQYANIGTVTGIDATEAPVTDSDPSHYFGVSGGLDIEKATNGVDADDPTGPLVPVGGAVSWSYVVTNNVNTTVTGIVVTDDQGVSVSCPAAELAAGASMTCTASGVAVAGQYANLGSVVGVDAAGRQLTDDDPSHYYGVAEGSIAILKLVDDLDDGWVPSALYPNDVADATWQITVTNAGPDQLDDVELTDLNAPACETAFAEAMDEEGWSDEGSLFLPVGAQITFECVSTLGIAAPGSNTAVVQGVDPLGRTVGPVASTAFVSRVAAAAAIGDTVWSDEDADGIQDPNEKGIAGATVRLTRPDGTTVDQKTNANGLYLFSALEPGTYTSALVLSSIPKPSDGELKLTTAGSFTVTLGENEEFLDADFGVVTSLPKTGFDTMTIALVGLLMTLLGVVVVLVTRRRDEDGGEIAAG